MLIYENDHWQEYGQTDPRTIFLYTKGTEGNPSEELRQFLTYMEHTTEENAKNENLRNIHQMVNVVKMDEEVSLEYMKIFEREQMLVKQGIEQGIKQGRKEEQANTERERRRADLAEKEAERLRKELADLKQKKGI